MYQFNNNMKSTIHRINCSTSLTGEVAANIRKQISYCISTGFDTIYLDTKEVINVDLYGINEIINWAYTFSSTSTNFVLVYQRASVLEKWVHTTGLDKFVKTAILPIA